MWGSGLAAWESSKPCLLIFQKFSPTGATQARVSKDRDGRPGVSQVGPSQEAEVTSSWKSGTDAKEALEPELQGGWGLKFQ